MSTTKQPPSPLSIQPPNIINDVTMGIDTDQMVTCQSCWKLIPNQPKICIQCTTILCTTCTFSHPCNHKDNNIDNLTVNTSISTATTLQKTVKCQRCQYKTAVIKCCQCKVQYLCNGCHTIVHKHKNKQHKVIDLTHNTYTNTITLDKNRQTLNKPTEDNSSNDLQKQLTVLSAMKTSLQQSKQTLTLKTKQTLTQITHTFNTLKQHLQLQEQLLLTELQQHTKQTNKDIEYIQKLIKQHIVKIQQNQLINSNIKSKRIEKMREEAQILAREEEKSMGWSWIEPQWQIINQQFNIDIQNIQDKVDKIQYNKYSGPNGILASSTISIPLSSPKKSQLKAKTQLKSHTNSQISILSSCKSMDKLSPLSLLLKPPETPKQIKKSQSKSTKHLLDKHIQNSTISIEPTLRQPAKSPKNSNSLHFNQNGGMYRIARKTFNPQDNKQQLINRTVKQPSTPRYNKGSKQKGIGLKQTNSTVGKAFHNIESTKKIIEEMRIEMDQFSNRRKRPTEQEEGLSLSHISIQSNKQINSKKDRIL